MEATFEHSVDVLVKAYLNDTLEVGNFCACAIGNLIAEQVGAKIVRRPDLPKDYCGYELIWDHPHYNGGEWYYCKSDKAFQLMQTTGYTVGEVMKIERAFERAGNIRMHLDKDAAMFAGLMGALEELALIHNISLEAKEEAKKLFVKA